MKNLTVLNSRAAAIDVGSESLHVSIAGGPPKVFGTFTGDLENLRAWLVQEGARTVAMEATGVYWLYLYEALEAGGLELVVVNGRHVQNVPGRKTDMADCQWLATLHAHGLLRGGFVPSADIRRLQDYQRLRSDHIMGAAAQVQKMQQALERMNVKVHDVICDLVGVSGLKVIRAILMGERRPGNCWPCVTRASRKRNRSGSRKVCGAAGKRNNSLRCGKPWSCGRPINKKLRTVTGNWSNF
jgi:hypothetical protein